MIYATLLRIPRHMLDKKENLVNIIRQCKKVFFIKHIRKSIRLINFSVRITDQHADCIVKNEIAILIEAEKGIKIPRIVKHLFI